METGALHSLFKQNHSQQVTSVSLRPGQLINGKIIKLFPDQIAEIQIGSQKMIAQLETALSANERYWFQVQPGEDKIRLKVMAAGSEEGKQSESLTKILGEFSLAANKENQELVRFFVKEHLPVNRDILQQASQWLTGASPNGSGLEAIKTMITRGLPLTDATFSALFTANKEPSLTVLMENLLKVIDTEFHTETSMKIKNLLNEAVPSNKINVAGQVLRQIVLTWLQDNGKDGQAAFRLIQQAAGLPEQESEHMVIQKMLSNLESVETADAEILSGFLLAKKVFTLLNRGDSAAAKQVIDSFLTQKLPGGSAQNGTISGLADSLKHLFTASAMKEDDKQEGIQAYKHLLTMAVEGIDDSAAVDQVLAILLGGKGKRLNVGAELLNAAGNSQKYVLSVQQAELLGSAIHQAESAAALSKTEDTILTAERIKSFLSSLGLSYERQLADVMKGSLEESTKFEDSLKPNLMRLLSDNPPQTVKEAAELLLNKITGFQLLSQETGPIQQLIVQMPFIIGGEMSELTVQWSGQRTEEGKISADFCRVLFYLKLEHLDDTIIDVQVQNRIMSMQVINQHPSLRKMADQLLPMLKTNLAEANYHLSSVNFQVPGAPKATEGQKKLSELYSKKDYSRVDIKI